MERKGNINDSSYEGVRKITEILENKEAKQTLIDFLNEMILLDLKDLKYNGIEKLQCIAEYDFYIINLKGTTKNECKQEIFIKAIKTGKIKESLFCICDLVYEKYLNKDIQSKEILKKTRKIAILEGKKNTKLVNKVLVNLFEHDLNQEKLKMEINFIQISKIIEQIQEEKNNKKGWKKCIENNPKDIIIVGVKNID